MLAEKIRALESHWPAFHRHFEWTRGGVFLCINARYRELLDLPESVDGPPAWRRTVRIRWSGLLDLRSTCGTEPARSYVASEYAAYGDRLTMPQVYAQNRLPTVTSKCVRACWKMAAVSVPSPDVTDYPSTQEALRLSEARWRSLTHLSSDWY